MVCTPCENFVMIDLVVFKLNGFEPFDRLCLKGQFRPPKVYNFIILPLVVYEILRDPKFTLGGRVPPVRP